MGFIDEGEVFESEYRFKNIGTDELKILAATVSCSCVSIIIPDGNSYGPGQEGTLLCSLDTTGISGNLDKQIQLRTNDNQDPYLYLRLKGIVRYVKVAPGELQISQVRRGEVIHKKLTAYCLGYDSINFEDCLVFNSDVVSVSAEGSTTSTYARKYTEMPFQVTIDTARMLQNQLKGKLLFRFTTPQGIIAVEVPLTINLRKRFQAKPSSVYFGRGHPGTTIHKICSIIGDGIGRENLLYETDLAGLDLMVGKKTENSCEISLTWLPPSENLGEVVRGAIRVVDDNGMEQIKIPVWGVVEK